MFSTVCMFVFFLSVEIAPAETPTPSVPTWIITSDCINI